MKQVIIDRKNKETLTKQQKRNKETYKVRCKLLSQKPAKRPAKPQFLAGKWPDAEGTLNGGKN